MTSRKALIIASIAIGILILAPEMGHAEDLLSNTLTDDIQNIKDTIFGAPFKIAGVLSGAYGTFQTIMTASPKPLMMWGAIGLIAAFMGKIITALFGV